MYDECISNFIWVDEIYFKFLGMKFTSYKANFYKNGNVSDFNYFAYSLKEDGYGEDSWYKKEIDGKLYLTFKPRMEIYLTDGSYVALSFNSYDEMKSYYINNLNGMNTLQIFGVNNIKYENGLYNGKYPRLW